MLAARPLPSTVRADSIDCEARKITWSHLRRVVGRPVGVLPLLAGDQSLVQRVYLAVRTGFVNEAIPVDACRSGFLRLLEQPEISPAHALKRIDVVHTLCRLWESVVTEPVLQLLVAHRTQLCLLLRRQGPERVDQLIISVDPLFEDRMKGYWLLS